VYLSHHFSPALPIVDKTGKEKDVPLGEKIPGILLTFAVT
jgi:hypothetical protein